MSCGGGNNNSTITDTLKDNLQNLNGQWGFKNEKDDEFWQLNICYNNDSKTGTYVLKQKYDSWGKSEEQKINTVSEGSFSLAEGFDRYGDKAYVGNNSVTGNQVFVITQLENKYASDWSLRITMIEQDMFGEHMTKLSNECK
jgi:hypothetical protein